MQGLLLALAIGATASASSPPAKFPEFDWNQGTVSVVLATSTPGDWLPEPPESDECKKPNIVCWSLHSPMWFRIRVLQLVYGQAPTERLVVSTMTHYGQPEVDDERAPRLLLLISHQGQTVMPLYSYEQAWRRSDGKYYLLLDSDAAVAWLPCDAYELREPIDDRMFDEAVRRPLDDYMVETQPQMYTNRGPYVAPRYGISVERLSDFLRVRQPSLKQLRCEQPKAQAER